MYLKLILTYFSKFPFEMQKFLYTTNVNKNGVLELGEVEELGERIRKKWVLMKRCQLKL